LVRHSTHVNVLGSQTCPPPPPPPPQLVLVRHWTQCDADVLQ
jgi:hypothetical protein